MQQTRLRVVVLGVLAFLAAAQPRLASAQKIDAKRMLAEWVVHAPDVTGARTARMSGTISNSNPSFTGSPPA